MKFPSKYALTIAVGLLISGSFTQNVYGAFPTLPDSTVTPGATNPLVNQQNIGTTICRSGYTATIRPTVSYTNKLKKTQLNTTYSNYGSSDLKLFEEDHLIPLELGGNPTNVKNLWPEPWTGNQGAHYKDQLENKLKSLVCARTLTLAVAQSAIATNWEVAYQRYILGIVEPSSTSSQAETAIPSESASSTPIIPVTTPTSLPSSVATPIPTSSTRPAGSTGKCNDGTYSFAATHRGMCSGHGGVAQFYT